MGLNVVTYALAVASAKKYVDDVIGSATGVQFVLVDELPLTGETGKIYLVPKDDSGETDTKDEYVWLPDDESWEKIGSTDVDLSGYVDQVNVGNTSYSPSEGVVSLPEYPKVYFGTSDPSSSTGKNGDLYAKISSSEYGRAFRIHTTGTGGETANITIDTITDGTVTNTEVVFYRMPNRTYPDFSTSYYNSAWHVSITSNNITGYAQGDDISWSYYESRDFTLNISAPSTYKLYIKSRGIWIVVAETAQPNYVEVTTLPTANAAEYAAKTLYLYKGATDINNYRVNGMVYQCQMWNSDYVWAPVHQEGFFTKANGAGAHAEGAWTYANGQTTHVEGGATQAHDYAAHAEGTSSIAYGQASHAEGNGTIVRRPGGHAQGTFNIDDTNGDYLHIVGNGTDGEHRSNAHTLDASGNAWFAGAVTASNLPAGVWTGTQAQYTQQASNIPNGTIVNITDDEEEIAIAENEEF